MASDSGDDAELRERVAALEETVAEQHHSIDSPEQPTASRRGFLSAAAAVAGLGALGIYSSYPASAQAAGQVGSASNPIDVEAWTLTVQNQLAGDLDAGGNDLTNVGAAEVGELSNEVLFASEFATSGSGTPTDPYVDGVRLAVESTNDPHYVVVDGAFKEDPINVLEGAYDQWREGPFSYASVPLVGFGNRNSMIVLKDGSNDSLIKADIDASSVSIDNNAQGPVLLNVGLIGNKDGQTGGPSHAIYAKESSGSPRVIRGSVYNIYVRWFRDDGLELANGAEMAKSTHIGVDASYQDGWAYRVPVQSNAHGVIARQSNRGVQVQTEGKMWGGNCVGHAERGAEVGTGAVLNGTHFENNNNGNNGDESIIVPGSSTGAVVANCSFNEDNVTHCVLNDGTETKFHNWTQRGTAPTYNNGFQATRSIINGVGRNAGDPRSTGQWNGNGIEGVGRNAGDPRSTGQWNGNGIEGLWVKDNSNDNLYLYRVTDWIQA